MILQYLIVTANSLVINDIGFEFQVVLRRPRSWTCASLPALDILCTCDKDEIRGITSEILVITVILSETASKGEFSF